MPMAASYTPDEDLNSAPHDVFDINGLLVAGPGNEGFITTSAGGAYDRQRLVYDRERMVLNYELQQLDNSRGPDAPQGLPKSEKVTLDQQYLDVANQALGNVQAAVDRAQNKVPQPTWLHDPSEFQVVVNHFFDKASQKTFQRSYQQGDGSTLDQTINSYDVRPTAVEDVSAKILQVTSQISQMDQLVKSIDDKFSVIDTASSSSDEKLILSKMLGLSSGVTHASLSIDAIYAVDPGRFEPKDGEGRPTKYDPKNLCDVLQAVEYFLENPARGMAEGMRLFGPNAIKELRDTMADMPKPAAPSIEGALAPYSNGPLALENLDDDNRPGSPGYNRKYRPPGPF